MDSGDTRGNDRHVKRYELTYARPRQRDDQFVASRNLSNVVQTSVDTSLTEATLLKDVRIRACALFRREVMEEELGAELQFHLDQLTEQHVRAGIGPREARRLARIALDGDSQVKEQCRGSWGLSWIDALTRNFRYALVRIRRHPRSAAVIESSLALGIGMSVAMFSLVDAVLLRPLPFPDQDSIYVIQKTDPLAGTHVEELAYPELVDL